MYNKSISKPQLSLISYTKINTKSKIYVTIKHKTMKLLTENIGEIDSGPGLGKEVLFTWHKKHNQSKKKMINWPSSNQNVLFCERHS